MLNEYELTHNIESCRKRIDEALIRSGRQGQEVLIVGASKTMNSDVVDIIENNHLLKALGENRVQELVDKYREGQGFDWHFIGVLQSNKVKYIIDKVSLIHSVDKVSLAKEIDKQANKHGLVMDILLQINMGKEESKSGFFIEDIEQAIAEISNFTNVNIRGLMAVMPIVNEEETIALYKELGDFYNSIKDKYNLRYLSCGMSNDFELAVEYAGSNIVRIGRAIFGERSGYGNV